MDLLSCRLAKVMDENFDTRREIYGDAALGEANLQMVNIARKHGSAVKFPGSGGAVIGLCLDKEKQVSGRETGREERGVEKGREDERERERERENIYRILTANNNNYY